MQFKLNVYHVPFNNIYQSFKSENVKIFMAAWCRLSLQVVNRFTTKLKPIEFVQRDMCP